MKLKDFTAAVESIAPLSLALEFDNAGLLISPSEEEITRVLVALDCTLETVREAKAIGAQLVLSHHPLLFEPVKHILKDDPNTAVAFELIRSGVGLYAAHTSLDACEGGVNDTLCEIMGINNAEKLPPENLGRIGTLPSPVTLAEFARAVEKKLNTKIRFAGDPNASVRRVAVVGGSGGSDLQAAKDAGADVLLTGEAKHSHALTAGILGISVVAAGHYETEHVALEPFIERLQRLTDIVQYNLTQSATPPLTTLRR